MSSRKKLNLNTVSVNLGCSCSRPKLSLLFHPKPKLKTTPKPHKRHHYSSSTSSSWTSTNDDDDTTTTTTTTTTSSTTPLSPNVVVSKKDSKTKKKEKKAATERGFGRVGGEGVAVEKDSDDPYLDFRHSMLQMILENEIYSKHHLRELLNCFLQLNSPSHHGIIVRAFAEIWDGVFSVPSSAQNSNLFHHQYNNNDTNTHHYCYNESRDYYCYNY